jgi:hypothetical protein
MTFDNEPTERKKRLGINKLNLESKERVEKLKSIRGIEILSKIF